MKTKENNKFAMKVNYVKVVDELLRIKNKVIIDKETKLFCDIVEKVIHRNWRPYFSTKLDKEDFAKEQYDRSFSGDYERWGR